MLSYFSSPHQAANFLVKAIENPWGRKLYAKTLLKNIGQAVYKVRVGWVSGDPLPMNKGSMGQAVYKWERYPGEFSYLQPPSFILQPPTSTAGPGHH